MKIKMPTINKLPKKEKQPRTDNTDNRLLRRKAYNNSSWRKLRNIYIKEHPLCADCLKSGKITAGEDVHHLKSPFHNGNINYELLLDYDNLETLCKECHANRHLKEDGKMSPEEMIKFIDDLFNDNISNEEIENDYK